MENNFRSALALSLALILSSMIGSWAFLRGKEFDQVIRVTGSAKLRIRSDLTIWRTWVIAEGPSLAATYEKVNRDIQKVQAFLTAEGVEAGQIVMSAVETTIMRRSTRQDPYGQSDTSSSGPISGYHLRQSITVRSGEVDKITSVSRRVTELIHQGILLQSEEPQYLYTRLAEIKVQILADAAKDAKARAEQISASTGTSIGDLRSAHMGVLQITAADSVEVSDYGINDTRSLEKDVTAVVHATFSLR